MRRINKSKVGTVGEYKYSGLWFFLLPELTKQLSGLSFIDFLNSYFYIPLKLNRLTFLPSSQFSKNEIVPTEIDSTFRKQLVQGWVHDEAAALMGGISGNAGLFANASSIAPILELFLNKG
ncbi:serine hydrolase, partial [Flavobacteriaceae bacterium]|nr:serine hydrolase [Flavobacteriaceae bacterium]